MDIIMLKNCGDQSKLVSSEIKFFAAETRFSPELRNHTGSNQKQSTRSLVLQGVTAGRVARTFDRGEHNNRVSTCKYLNAPCF